MRSRVKSGELFNDTKPGNDHQEPMNYEEWSKSLELARTFRSDFDGESTAENKGRFLNRSDFTNSA